MRSKDQHHMEESLNTSTPRILNGSPPEKKAAVAPQQKGQGEREETVKESADGRCSCLQKCCRAFLILTLVTASVISLSLAVILYTSHFVDSIIQKNLVIKNGSQHYEWWKNPPVGTLVRIKLFNYTNYEAYMRKTEAKLKLQEVGPYVYRLKVSKVNVDFPASREGEIVTFQVNKTYEFAPELSPGVSEDDLIVSPNFNLLGVASAIHDSHLALKISLMTALQMVKVDTFLRLPAGQLLWGYDDPIFDRAKQYVTFKRGTIPMKKFGLLAGENGLSPDRISIHTGKQDPSLLGVISAYNGNDSLPFWGGRECNRVDGSEGSIFPQTPATTKFDPMVNLKTHVFSYHLCRRYPFEQRGEVMTPGGIPAIRFSPPSGVYDSPLDQPEHRCFCDPQRSYCPPSGVFNVSPCAYGAPVMISFPHFYGGHPSLVEHFEGLHQEKKQYEFFLDVQPTLGVPLRAESAFQMNAMVRPSWVIKPLMSFPSNLIMPLLWAQAVSDEIPDYLIRNIRFATQTSYIIENLLIGTLFTLSVVFMVIAIVLVSRTIVATSQRQQQEEAKSGDEVKKIPLEKCSNTTKEKV